MGDVMGDVSFDYRSVSLEDRVALEALCVEYLWRVDHGRADQIPELFTDDGVFDSPSVKSIVRGREALVAAWNERVKRSIRTMHQLASCRFSMDGPNRARGTIGFTLFAYDGEGTGPSEPKLVAEHQDEYERGADGRWRIRHRRVVSHFGSV